MAPLQTQTTQSIDDITTMNDGTPIQQFYNKKSIFMTGGTGFLGKIIMDKLLRSTNIETIYLLIRSKKGKDVHTRLEDIFDDPLFEKLKAERPKFRHHVVGITGDCILPDLGIDIAERTILKNNVNVIFHVAATVRFDEKLKLAIGINVIGTKSIINLCREVKDLKAFVHISTAYANCHHLTIEEKFYEPSLTGANSIKLSECLDEKTLDAITPELIKEYPNTYTFTKCLAEDYIRSNSKGLPVAVFRPAIVIPTYKEPVEGWIDNMYGPTGIVVGVGAGLIRILQVNKKNNAEIVPVDMCVNSLLASAWDISKNTYDEPPVYNYVTSERNPITWETYCNVAVKHGSRVPLEKSIWFYTLTFSTSWFLVKFLTFFYHIIPAMLMDSGLLLLGKKTKMLQIYKKIHKFCDVLSYFTNTKFVFTNNNVMSLWEKLSREDQELFYFNMDNVDWNKYIMQSMHGIRKYLMKEDPETGPAAYKRMMKLKVCHYTLIYTIYGIILYLFYLLLSSFIF